MLSTEIERKVRSNFLLEEQSLSPYATKEEDAIRFQEEPEDVRPNYFHDTDRIIYALSFTRYMNKTQVFSFLENDHLTKRIVHVQFVSKIARTIGRALRLNEDLIEAIALGHDIGHTPIGHVGEKILNDLSLRELGERFNHNVQSVRVYLELERNGIGSNLTLQTLDGILCHNGELEAQKYQPIFKTKEQFLEEYHRCYTDLDTLLHLHPMTLEGCVVRISDIIAYLGRDIEDGMRLHLITKDDLPKHVVEVLGSSNREIINRIILDIIENSLDQPYIRLSDEVYQAIVELKKFNYQHIYLKANNEATISFYTKAMEAIYEQSLQDLEEKKEDSAIYCGFLKGKSPEYLDRTSNKRKVIDYIAGMTDDYFIRQARLVGVSFENFFHSPLTEAFEK